MRSDDSWRGERAEVRGEREEDKKWRMTEVREGERSRDARRTEDVRSSDRKTRRKNFHVHQIPHTEVMQLLSVVMSKLIFHDAFLNHHHLITNSVFQN